ncbi:MAG: hypothetical protein ABIP71_10580 [Verrucomicrobiota bacterium]
MFTAQQLKERMEEKPFRPFRMIMSSGDTYEVRNHDSAWVLRNAIEIGLDPDAEGMVALTRRCAILHIASIEDIPTPKAA